MADNVPVTAGSGTTIATDEKTINATAVQVQRVNMAVGKDGSYVGDTSGRLVDGDANASALFVDQRPNSTLVQVSSAGLTIATTAYTAGDVLGTELTFASAARAAGGMGRITGAMLVDKAKLVSAVDLFLFDRSVTHASDNAANAWSDADALFCVGVIEFPAPKQSGNNFIAQCYNLPIPYRCNATSLFGGLVTRSGHSFFTATTDLVVSLIVELD